MVAAPLAVAAGETVPHGDAEHDTVQVTPLFAESLVTVATSVACVPFCSEVGGGCVSAMVTLVIVMATVAVLVVSALAVAVMATMPLGGTELGAVKVVAAALVVFEGLNDPQSLDPVQTTVQTTPALVGSFATVAIKGT